MDRNDQRRPTKRSSGSNQPRRRSVNKTSAPTGRRTSSVNRTSLKAGSQVAGTSRATRSRTSQRPTSYAGKRSGRPSARKQGVSTASEIGSSRVTSGIWTKSSTKGSGASSQQGLIGSPAGRASRGASTLLGGIAHAFAGIGAAIGKAFQGGFFSSTKAKAILAVLLVLVVVGGIDQVVNADRLYNGITIGDVEVGGKTTDEAKQMLQDYYSGRVEGNTIVFYADDDAMANPQAKDSDANIDEQVTYEQSLENRRQWTVPASQVEAVLNIDGLVSEAYAVGRDNGGIFARLGSQLFGTSIDAACSFNEATVNELAKTITATIGKERVNYNIQMEDAKAKVTSGNDGNEVTHDWLEGQLNAAYLGSEAEVSVVAITEYMPLQIDEEEAQRVADVVNASLSQGAVFTFNGQSWTASTEDLAALITTEVQETGTESWKLVPLFDETTTKSVLLSNLQASIDNDGLEVKFKKADDGTISVSCNATGTVPKVEAALETMDNTMFVDNAPASAPEITIEETELPSSMSVDDAKSYGVIGEVSSFTTEYSSSAEARKNNIHLAADMLSNSIVKANGGEWDFNEITGERTEDKGFQSAGAIVQGEYSDAIGGGICQVATTVFNSIYEAGYPVLERHNHTLYISSYPEGRDAAVSYPDLDLRWQNDTTSDVLLVMSYTDSSVTATLLGVDPGYQVSTETGEWQKGAEYKTKYRNDDTIASGTEYVETTGTNGRSITIVRTVKDADGNVLHSDTFSSNYAPKNEVIVKGTA